MVLFHEIDIPTLLDISANNLTRDVFAPVLSQVEWYNCVLSLCFDFMFGSEE